MALVAGLSFPGMAAAAGIDLAIGFERQEGEFHSDDTRRLDQVYLQFELGGSGSRFLMRLPYWRIDRIGNVTATPDGPILVGAGGPGRPPWQESEAGEKEAGLGDLYLRTETLLMQAGKGKRPALILVSDLKWPTADESRGLGTGEYDWGIGIDYIQPMSKAAQFLGSAAYRFMGSPEDADFENRLRFLIGFAFVTSRTTWRIVGESLSPVLDQVPLFDATGTAIALQDVEDSRIARGEMAIRSSAGGSVRFYVLTGLNDSSPDLGFGLVFASRPQ